MCFRCLNFYITRFNPTKARCPFICIPRYLHFIAFCSICSISLISPFRFYVVFAEFATFSVSFSSFSLSPFLRTLEKSKCKKRNRTLYLCMRESLVIYGYLSMSLSLSIYLSVFVIKTVWISVNKLSLVCLLGKHIKYAIYSHGDKADFFFFLPGGIFHASQYEFVNDDSLQIQYVSKGQSFIQNALTTIQDCYVRQHSFVKVVMYGSINEQIFIYLSINYFIY